MSSMNHDVRNSLTALLGVLLIFCAIYALIGFPDDRFSWTASGLAVLLLLAIVILRSSLSPRV
jgi:hypothetical protein